MRELDTVELTRDIPDDDLLADPDDHRRSEPWPAGTRGTIMRLDGGDTALVEVGHPEDDEALLDVPRDALRVVHPAAA